MCVCVCTGIGMSTPKGGCIFVCTGVCMSVCMCARGLWVCIHREVEHQP